MAPKKSVLEKMRANPRGDWTIAQIETLCVKVGIEIRKPSGSSHYVLSSPFLRDSLTVPYKRPIKPLYVKKLVSYTDAHQTSRKESENE
jgi:hypothetical protein